MRLVFRISFAIIVAFAACVQQTANANQTHITTMNKAKHEIAEARFWSKVNKSATCWMWTACKNSKGYGSLRPFNGERYAHRASWVIANGAIKDGAWVLHKCDNPACVNPHHLWLGSNIENQHDMYSKGRGKKATGDAHWSKLHPDQIVRGSKIGTSKLTESDVVQIRTRYANGEISQQNLANEFCVHQTIISDVIRRVTWNHVTPP